MIIEFSGQEFMLHASGALYWPARQTLVIADAHLEKGSFFARFGFHLPPYDSHDTLKRLMQVCENLPVKRILILGDFFHDSQAHHRLSAESLVLFQGMKKFSIIWVKGNHDVLYEPPGMEVFDEYMEEGIVFRHEARDDAYPEISGHFHPKGELSHKGKTWKERCFVEDGKKLMLPAFGAYTGGLSIRDKVIRRHFGEVMRHYIVIGERVISAPNDF